MSKRIQTKKHNVVSGLIAVVFLIGLVVSACGPAVTVSPAPTTAPTQEVNTEQPVPTSTSASLHDMLPDAIKSSGEILAVTDPSMGPPWMYHPGDDPNVYGGIDVDMANAIAQHLGVTIKWESLAFTGFLPALEADRYDLAMVGMWAKVEREKVIDQIVYVKDSSTIIVPKGNPKGIHSLADFCGIRVSVPAGTNQADIVAGQQAKCSTPIDILTFPAKSDSLLALQSGRADATIDGYAVSQYLYANNLPIYQGLEPLSEVVLKPGELGIGFSKNQTQLRDAVVAALNAMRADGTYLQVLKKWNISAGAVDEFLVNPHLTGVYLHNMLPDDIKSSGKITIVTDASFGPPWNYHPGDDPNVYAGIDVDLANAIAQKLGVSIEWTSTAFSGIVPALEADRYNLAMVGMTAKEEREQVIDMIVYVNDANTIIVAKGNPKGIHSLEDLCGINVAVPAGTHQFDIVAGQQAKCSTPINIQTFPAKADVFLNVQSGRADATVDGYAVSLYLYANNVAGFQGLEPLPEVVLDPGTLGIGLSKNQTQLRDAVVAALKIMLADGTYMRILDKWGISAGAVDKILVNPHLTK